MKRLTLFAGAVLLATIPALAQTDGTVVITPPGQPPAHVPPGGRLRAPIQFLVPPDPCRPPAEPRIGPRPIRLGPATLNSRTSRCPLAEPVLGAVAAASNLRCRLLLACTREGAPC